MSRTYRKYTRAGIAFGDNRSFYKIRRRHQRTLNKRDLQKLSNLTIESFSEVTTATKLPKKDTWTEPTDGYILLNKNNYKNYKYYSKYGKYYLKNKHQKL